eukprot:6152987-Heterocapsa_arctica.AAC.1
MGHEGGPGEQCGVARLQQGEGQLSRDFRERRQVGRGLLSNYREGRFCTYNEFIYDYRSDQHQLGHSRQ